eukprot:4176595-Amphidinium_carterae.1
MELHTRLPDQSIECITAGSLIYTGVKDSQDRSQGFALLVATGPGAVEANGVAVSAWLAGASDAYYLWWAEQKAGPALPPATFKVLLVPSTTTVYIPQGNSDTIISQQYILLDPEVLHVCLPDRSFTGWSLDSMRRLRRRLIALQPH